VSEAMDESQGDTERVTGQTDDRDVNEPKNMEVFGGSYMTSYAIRDGGALILDTYITQPATHRISSSSLDSGEATRL